MQNHLLQVMAIFAMEDPLSLDAEDIRNEKARPLRRRTPLGAALPWSGLAQRAPRQRVTAPPLQRASAPPLCRATR